MQCRTGKKFPVRQNLTDRDAASVRFGAVGWRKAVKLDLTFWGNNDQIMIKWKSRKNTHNSFNGKTARFLKNQAVSLELLVRIELTTFSLRVRCSAIEPQKQFSDTECTTLFSPCQLFFTRGNNGGTSRKTGAFFPFLSRTIPHNPLAFRARCAIIKTTTESDVFRAG